MKPSLLTRALNLREAGIFRLLVTITALLCAVLGLSAASSAMLQNLYAQWHLNRSHSLTVYLPPDSEPSAVTQLQLALPTLQGVVSATQVEAAQLRRWLAPLAAETADLPLPAVIRVAYQGSSPPAAALEHILAAFPTAEVDDHRPMLAEVGRAVRGLQAAALALGVAMLAVMGLLITLVTRTGLMTTLPTLHLLVQLGAADATLTRNISAQILLRTLAGYALGTAAAAGVVGLAALASPGLAMHITWVTWAALAGLPVVLPLLAAVLPLLAAPLLLRRLT